jgi:glycerate 2-kinase
MTGLSDIARRIAAAALAAVDPERLVRETLKESRFDAVLAVGKAAAALARGVPNPPSRRLLIRPHTSPPLGDPDWEELSGGHPLPDHHSLAAGERLRDWLTEIGPMETLLALISGGSSACIELPADGLSLNDVIRENRRLLASGLPIGEVNAVRKRFSALKGGGALRLTRGRVVVLLLSDVPGDDPGTIGSGLFEGAETILLGSVRTAMAGAAAEARLQGFSVTEGDLEGEASKAGRGLVERGRSLPGDAVALILGGETTVTLSPESGRGGRNGELALAAARDLSDGEVVLALATDGEDGTTGTTGAVVDARTWNACPDPERALARHDSLTALEGIPGVPGALLRTGVTGTNVGDLALYLRGMK